MLRRHVITDSLKEFKNLRSIVFAALLIALHTVLAVFVSIQITPSLRISVSFITNVITGALFGPIMGAVCGGLGDIIQFLIKPSGGYFYGWTINAALAGFIYRLFFYKRFPSISGFKKMRKDKSDKNADIEKARRNKRITIIDSIITVVISVTVIAAGFIFKFADVIDSNSKEVIFSGNCWNYILNILKENTKSCSIIALLMMIAAVLVLILSCSDCV